MKNVAIYLICSEPDHECAIRTNDPKLAAAIKSKYTATVTECTHEEYIEMQEYLRLLDEKAAQP